jgi:hypothetical protein
MVRIDRETARGHEMGGITSHGLRGNVDKE